MPAFLRGGTSEGWGVLKSPSEGVDLVQGMVAVKFHAGTWVVGIGSDEYGRPKLGPEKVGRKVMWDTSSMVFGYTGTVGKCLTGIGMVLLIDVNGATSVFEGAG